MATRAPAVTDEMIPRFPGMLDMSTPSPFSAGVEVITEREFKNAAEMEAFMQTDMVIRIHRTADPKSAPAVGVGVNGDRRWLPRGVPIKIKRMFVENLARSIERNVETIPNPDKQAEDGYLMRGTSTSPYGFEVLWDGAPAGRAWLERVMAEGR